MALDGAALARLRALASDGYPRDGAPDGVQVPPAGPHGPRRTLTVGMAVYDDYDGVYFTVNALRMYHPEAADRVALLVVDNNPGGPGAWHLKALEKSVPGLRYVPAVEAVGTAVRDRVFREADSDWTLCVDAHVLFAPGALRRLLEFCDANPDCPDLLQGPLVGAGGGEPLTHWDPVWSHGMFGTWGTPDPRGADPDGAPFEIGMQGLGVFGCRTDRWLGLNPLFRGHGGEEGYLQEKYRARGARVLCLPFLRWAHRFARPGGSPYSVDARLRVRNYLIGWEELGIGTEAVTEHFAQRHGRPLVERAVRDWEREKKGPFAAFGTVLCLNLDSRPDRWAQMREQFEVLGIGNRVHRLPAVPTPGCPAVGCALSHRRAIERAHAEGRDSVLVLEDDVVFLQGANWLLERAMAELSQRTWQLLYLGSAEYTGRVYPLAPGCRFLQRVDGLLTTHALAYHRSVYDALLTELPADEEGMRAWVAEHTAIDVFLQTWLTDGVYRTDPPVASQRQLVARPGEPMREHFTLGATGVSGARADGTAPHNRELGPAPGPVAAAGAGYAVKAVRDNPLGGGFEFVPTP